MSYNSSNSKRFICHELNHYLQLTNTTRVSQSGTKHRSQQHELFERFNKCPNVELFIHQGLQLIPVWMRTYWLQSGPKVGIKPRSCHTASCVVDIFNMSCEIHLFHWLLWLQRPCAVHVLYALPAVCHPPSFALVSRWSSFADQAPLLSLVALVACQARSVVGLGFSLSYVPLGGTCLAVRGWRLFLLHEQLPPLHPAPRKEGGTARAACVTSSMLQNRAAMWLPGII